jgi:hypothetical protein
MTAKLNSTLMNETVSNVREIRGSAPVAARIALVASAASLGFLGVLHVLSPEFDPSWRMVSEYALGTYGWVLSLMFLTWALTCVALVFAIKSQIKTIGGKLGLGFLLISALGMAMAAFFDVNHNLHGLAAMIGIPSLPIAAVLASVSLGRNPAWTSARRSLLWAASLTWIGLILMNVAIFTGFTPTGEALPTAWFGWANRLLILAYDVWLMAVAWRALQMQRSLSSQAKLL